LWSQELKLSDQSNCRRSFLISRQPTVTRDSNGSRPCENNPSPARHSSILVTHEDRGMRRLRTRRSVNNCACEFVYGRKCHCLFAPGLCHAAIHSFEKPWRDGALNHIAADDDQTDPKIGEFRPPRAKGL